MPGQRSCPACASAASRVAGEKNGFELRACAECRTLFATPLPTSAQMESIYWNYSYQGSGAVVPAVVTRQLERMVKRFEPWRETGRLIDVGCGAGFLLEAARTCGWTAEGLETSDAAVKLCSSKGLSARKGDFLDYRPSLAPDVVVMIELLEHLPSPVDFIRHALEILRPGGLLFATTPNASSLSRRLLGLKWAAVAPPEHIQLFTPRGISTMLTRAGFFPVRTATSGLNVYSLRDHFFPTRRTSSHVENAFSLNEALTRSRGRRAMKALLNAPLAALGIGDSLSVSAIRRSVREDPAGCRGGSRAPRNSRG